MAVLGRVPAAFAAALRSLRYSDKGVTAVEYGVLVALLGVAMLGAVAGLYSAATASYNRSEGEVGNLGTSCVGDEVIDPVSGLCSDNPLSISGVTPAYGPPAGGTTVTITVIFTKSGFTLAANPAVTFDGNPATLISSTPSVGGGTIVVTSPLGTLGPADVVVNNPGTIATTDTAFSAFTYATIPGAPGTPVATAGDESASLTWGEPSDFGGLPLTDYEVQYRASAGAWTAFPDAGGATLTTTVTGLTNGTPYEFQVRAVNAVGPGPWSNASLPVTPAPTGPVGPTAPTAPTITGITGGNKLLTVNFNAPSSDGGQTITNYEYTTDGSTWTAFSPVDTSSPLVITGLADSTTYTVQIRAVNGIPTGAASIAAVGTTSPPPTTVPSAPQAPTGVLGDGEVVVNWVAPADGGSPIDVYDVQYSTSATGPWTSFSNSLAGLSAAVDSLTNGTPYYFQVAAHNANGWSAFSPSSAAVTPVGAPGAPSITGITTPAAKQLSVAFTPPGSDGGSAITTYQYSTDGGSTWKTRTTGSTASPILITQTSAAGATALADGTSYNVQIRAVNVINPGPASTTVVGTTIGVPGAPSITGITTPAAKQLSVAFTPPGSDGGSAITTYQYSTDGGSTWKTRTTGSTASPILITQTSAAGATALADGTSYNVQIRAVNVIGPGPASATTVGVTLCGTPDAPSGLKGVFYDQRMYLSWTAPAGAGGCAIDRYQVQYSSNGTTWSDWATNVSGTTYKNGSNLGTGNHYVRVRARNAAGTWSAYSTIGPIGGCGNNLLRYGGSCIALDYRDSDTVAAGGSVTTGNVIGTGRTYASFETLTEPTGGGAGTVSSSGRKITYNAPNAVGWTLIYFTFTGSGGGDGVLEVEVQP